MNKLIILSALAATVLIAGIFAFMPVEKASTVHATILANTFTTKILTGTCETDGDNNNGIMDTEDGGPCDVTIDIAEGVPFQVVGVEGSITNRDDGERFDFNKLCYGPLFTKLGYGMGSFSGTGQSQRVASEDEDRHLAVVGLGAGTLTMDNEVGENENDDSEVEVVTINIILLIPGDAPDPILTFVDDLPSSTNCDGG